MFAVDFAKRHKRKFLVLGTISAGVWALGKYAQSKLVELTKEMDTARGSKANMNRRFRQNQQDCTFTILSLLPTLAENLLVDLDVERLINSLHKVKGKSPEKLAIWEELKVMSFARSLSAIYLTNFLVLFTQTQLNLLGRFIYLDSVPTLGRDYEDPVQIAISTGNIKSTSKSISAQGERTYLTFSWYLLNIGWKVVKDIVEDATKQVLDELSVKDGTTHHTIFRTIGEIRKIVESDKRFNIVDILMPKEGEEAEVLQQIYEGVEDGEEDTVITEEVKGLLDETRDYLECEDMDIIVNSCLDSTFELFLKKIEPIYFPNAAVVTSNRSSISNSRGGSADMHPSEIVLEPSLELPLAKVIPPVSKLAHAIFNDCPNQFVDCITKQKELESFSMIVYTGWD